ncbi:hypothetical protein H6770_03365 [Candidatus Peribacteria bacterium]|nr:hypothetical protein [Candidatus Peribacteria bacterium]
MNDIILYLHVTVGVLLIVVLYHILFVVVDLRKIMRRVQLITKEIEGLVMKPITVADQILEGVLSLLEDQQKKTSKKSSKKKR